jgi:hypothetical protein
MGIEEEIQAKGICNIFNKMIIEIFTNLRKSCPCRYRKSNRLDQIRNSLQHIIKQQAQRTEKEY